MFARDRRYADGGARSARPCLAGPLGGAWFSFVWPTRQPPAAYGNVSLLAAIAVRRAIAEVVDAQRLSIKWPNDVLVDGKKVSGILCEQWPGEVGQLGALVIGIGINVHFDLGSC